MIKINGKELKVGHYPDHTQAIDFSELIGTPNTGFTPNCVEWYYDSDEELMTLKYVVFWMRKCGSKIIRLFLPYVPNARMDRVKGMQDNFALKVFADDINSLHFDSVEVFNVHSNVSEAVINNIKNLSPDNDVFDVIKKYNPDVIFFPDEGACKRYSDLKAVKTSGLPVTFGIKKRDWKTGTILGLDVISDTELTGKKVLIVDDICSAGGTFKFSSKKLKELGASDVALYISHCEDNIQNGDLLKTDLVSKIYTTDTILHIENEKIEVIKEFRK